MNEGFSIERAEPWGLEVDPVITSTIKATLNDIFGRSVTRSINKAMKAYSCKWEEVPCKAWLFSELLCRVIGEGHVIVEDLILENLYEKIGLEYEYIKGYEFHNYIEKIRIK